jgi:chorismate mutase-like protein
MTWLPQERALLALPVRLGRVCLVLTFLVCASPLALADETDQLFASLAARLAYMPDVARYKLARGIAVEDLPREAIVLENSGAAATLAGLDPTTVSHFFQVQIDVAKAIQMRHMNASDKTTAAESIPDLDGEIRPALDRLGDQIIALLAECLRSRGNFKTADRTAFDRALERSPLTATERQQLFTSLLPVRLRD